MACVLPRLLPAIVGITITTAVGASGSCKDGTPISNPEPFWTPDPSGDPWSLISHRTLPYNTEDGYTINAGKLGLKHFADPSLLRELDHKAQPYANGQVDTNFGLPTSTTGGWKISSSPLHYNFHQGLNAGGSTDFGILLQKKSNASNIEIVSDVVDGVEQNVLKLTAHASEGPSGNQVDSAALVQTGSLFSSGRYEVKAKFPPKKGLAFAVWTFHYERHLDSSQLPGGQSDPQYVQNVSGWVSRTNHEIDIEMPASCSGLCGNTGGCPAEFDTMNINNYIFTNSDAGTGPAYSNMCVKAPSGKSFIDGKYHTYAIEWHTGNPSTGCSPRVDFFFDGDYIGTNDVFVPSRGSRLIFGMWPAGKNWVGDPDWEETSASIAEIHVCPFNEPNDADYPQIYDQPSEHQIWKPLNPLPPAVKNAPAPSTRCPGDSPAGPTCDSRSNRPNGCECNQTSICSSGCCDFSQGGSGTGVCAHESTCAWKCSGFWNRPLDCKCSRNSRCKSSCCQNSKCVDASLCADPCSKPSGRPNKCSCNLKLQCSSGCCDYNALPGPTNGSCADTDVCAKECSSSARPIGCQCQESETCQSGCCDGNVCKTPESCPSPKGCSGSTDLPVGCACSHSWECSTNWCDGHCELH